jgi:hypothetical protein
MQVVSVADLQAKALCTRHNESKSLSTLAKEMARLIRALFELRAASDENSHVDHAFYGHDLEDWLLKI